MAGDAQQLAGVLNGPTVPRNSGYLVPCVFKAVQMIQALRVARVGLRVEDFLGMTGYSRSTVYRILRTLTACEYIVREAGGVYHPNHSVISVADEVPGRGRSASPASPTFRAATGRSLSVGASAFAVTEEERRRSRSPALRRPAARKPNPEIESCSSTAVNSGSHRQECLHRCHAERRLMME